MLFDKLKTINSIEKITCPNCQFNFDVEENVASKLKARIKKEFQKKKEEWIKDLNTSKNLLEEQMKGFEETNRYSLKN